MNKSGDKGQIKRQKIAIICPRTKEYCGVYDYSTILTNVIYEQDKYQVTLITNRSIFHDKKFSFELSKRISKWNFSGMYELAQYLKKNHFRFVNIQFVGWMYGKYGCPLPLVFFVLLLRFWPVDVILTAHELYVPFSTWRWKILGVLQRMVFFTLALLATSLIVPIKKWQEKFQRNILLCRKSIFCVPITSNIQPVKMNGDIRVKLKIAKDDFVISVFSPNGSGKMTEMINNVFGKVRKNFPATKLCLIGDKNSITGKGVISIKQLPAEEISSILLSSDIYFCPFIDGVSTRRGSLLAAMQHGLPIVTTSGEATDDLFYNSPIIMTKINDMERMVLEIEKMITDQKYRKRIGRKTKEFYDNNFSAKNMNMLYQKAFASSVERRMVPKNILFIDQAKEIGGAELSLISVAKNITNSTVGVFEKGLFSERLIAEGINSSIIGINGNLLGFSKEEGNLFRLLKSIPSLIAAIFKIIVVIRKYDVVCFNTQKALILGIIPAVLLRKNTIFFLRDIISRDHFGRFNIKLIVFSANLCKKIICNSNATRNNFALSGGKLHKSITIYNGIDPRPFQNIKQEKIDDLKLSLGLNGKYTIGSFSRIAEWKGQHVLVKAMKNLSKDFHCLIVGSPFFNEDEYYLRLKNMVKKLKLSARVHFVEFTKDVPLYINTCDIIVHTSIAPEPFGRVIVEAMMAGKPMIATNMGGAKEIITDGLNAFLVRPNDHKVLAKTIQSICDNVMATKNIGISAKLHATKHFSEETMVNKIISELL